MIIFRYTRGNCVPAVTTQCNQGTLVFLYIQSHIPRWHAPNSFFHHSITFMRMPVFVKKTSKIYQSAKHLLQPDNPPASAHTSSLPISQKWALLDRSSNKQPGPGHTPSWATRLQHKVAPAARGPGQGSSKGP